MWIIAALVFVTTLLVAYLLVNRAVGARITVAERLETYTAAGRAVRPIAQPRTDDARGQRLAMLRLEDLLEEADVPIRPFEFVLLSFGCALALGAVGLVAGRSTAVAVLLGVPGLIIPIVWVRVRRVRRQHAFVQQLPDALQSISNSLRAGFGFNQGMATVASDLAPPISVEFSRAMQEINLGLTVDDALQNMARRVRSLDLDLAVAGILINRQVGGNLAELLDHVTATLRERVKLKNFIRVLTAQQRLSAIIIMIVPPILLLVLLLGLREYTGYLVTTRIGLALLALAAVMQALGIYFIRRIVAIDV
ncbi:MAG: type II secretion system F family protein [Armatimonadota bacterium]|nr:type II secretion system F family protein [Armatimonadota bacterium]